MNELRLSILETRLSKSFKCELKLDRTLELSVKIINEIEKNLDRKTLLKSSLYIKQFIDAYEYEIDFNGISEEVNSLKFEIEQIDNVIMTLFDNLKG